MSPNCFYRSIYIVDESADDFVIFLNEIDLEREIAILLLRQQPIELSVSIQIMLYCL